uniref:Sushi domain-containing protein n=1 Tax=Poecilia formosa TaxID=48698 RepID=A0A087XBL6_POEFO
MHMITRSCVLLLWSQLLTSVTCQDCTLEQFLNSRHFDSNFDVSGLDATYSGGKQVRVPCSVGYTGYFKLICTEGNWIPSGRKCEPKSCGHPGDAQFGDFRLVVGDDYVFGSQIVYECNPGYHMVSRSSRRRCLADGWDGTIAVCEVITCEIGGQDPNLYVSGLTPIGGTIKPGHKLSFLCAPGYQLDGSKETECLPTGQWTASFPSCSGIPCKVEPLSVGLRRVGSASQNLVNPGDILRFLCEGGYTALSDSASPSSKLTINDICPIIPAIKCDLALASIPGTTYDPSYKNMFSPGETVRVTCGEKHWILDMQTTVADVTC